MSRSTLSLLIPAALLLALSPTVSAQVGSALIVTPWQPGKSFSATNYFFGIDSESDGVDDNTDLFRGVSFGRFRADNQNPQAPVVGWLYDHLELDTSDPALPERLVAAAGAVGFHLGEVADGWRVGVAGGAGFAGDLPFADEDAWYALGSVYARKALDQRRFVTLLLDYDGSRAIFPDIPLPGFQYTVIQSRQLQYSLGLPFSTVTYAPDEHWKFDVQYVLPIGGRALVEYRFNEQWTAYGSFSSTTRGYHLDGDDEDRRLFFHQERLETGVRLTPQPGWTWTLAGGWAFGQEFTRGWDVRDDERIRELDDAPYLRVGLKVDF